MITKNSNPASASIKLEYLDPIYYSDGKFQLIH